MPVQLTGITGHGQGSSAANRGDRKTDLQTKIAQNPNLDAKGTLIALRGHLEGAPRNGFLRLDGSGREGDLSFSTHAWKGWGKSAKGEVTGAALRALFVKAGYNTDGLDTYLGQPGQAGYRGNQRVELANLRTIMDNAGIPIPAANARQAAPQGPPALQIPNDALVVEQHLDQADFVSADAMIGKGGLGSAYRTTLNGEPAVVKFLDNLNPRRLELDRNNLALKPGRIPEYTVAYMKDDVHGVVRPTHFLVRETGANGVSRDLIVKGGPDFKGWVRDQLTQVDEETGSRSVRQNPPQLVIVGMIMPEAVGKTLSSLYDNGGTLAPGMFSNLASSGFAVLSDMASHGFVHGDIKPANIISDDNGQVSMIDTGSMAKISKKTAEKSPLLRNDSDYFDKGTRPTTPGYTHPGYTASPNRVGMEQDLFGMGVTLLETKLMGITAELISQNRSDDADEFSEAATTILNEIKSANDANQLKGEILTQLGELKMLHPGMFADGEIDWTMMCIGKALERREPAIDGKTWQAELAQLRAQIP